MIKDKLKGHVKSSFYSALCLNTVLDPSYKAIHDTAFYLRDTLASLLMLNYLEIHPQANVETDIPLGVDLLQYMLDKYKVEDIIAIPVCLKLLDKVINSDCITADEYEFVKNVEALCSRIFNVDFVDTDKLSKKEVEDFVSKPFLLVGYYDKKDCDFCPFSYSDVLN